MKITHRIHINPQSKGSLGKSFETEFRTAWLDALEIPWQGYDLDDRHHTFKDRHPDKVQSFRLGNEQDSKATLLNLFRKVSVSESPVHVIDCRSQADDLVLKTLDELQLLDSMQDAGVRFTFLLFPSEDTESMNNLMDLFEFAGDRVDYVIVHNPAKVRTDLFTGSSLERELRSFGATSITLPGITSVTLLAIKRAELKAQRKLAFNQVANSNHGYLERLLAGEMQWAIQRMFPQYLQAARLLLPEHCLPEMETSPTKTIATSQPKQRHLNLGE